MNDYEQRVINAAINRMPEQKLKAYLVSATELLKNMDKHPNHWPDFCVERHSFYVQALVNRIEFVAI